MDKRLQKYMNCVEGENRGSITVFALSNCAWCKAVKKLLNTMDVEYCYIDADRVEKKDRQTLMETLEKWNPACIFPTVVINEDICIMGADEYRIRKALENPQITTITDGI